MIEIIVLYGGIFLIAYWAKYNSDNWGEIKDGQELIYIIGVLIIGYIISKLA